MSNTLAARGIAQKCLERERISHAKAQRPQSTAVFLRLLCVFALLRENYFFLLRPRRQFGTFLCKTVSDLIAVAWTNRLRRSLDAIE